VKVVAKYILRKPAVQVTLTHLPKAYLPSLPDQTCIVSVADVLKILHHYKHNACTIGIVVKLIKIRKRNDRPAFKELDYQAFNNGN
jgi:hypothetical protein